MLYSTYGYTYYIGYNIVIAGIAKYRRSRTEGLAEQISRQVDELQVSDIYLSNIIIIL